MATCDGCRYNPARRYLSEALTLCLVDLIRKQESQGKP